MVGTGPIRPANIVKSVFELYVRVLEVNDDYF